MSDVEWAWCAGFFDGEGSTCGRKDRGSAVILSITQNSPDDTGESDG